MARISRLVVPGYPHHVTQRGVRSIPIFSNDQDRSAYADIWEGYLRQDDEKANSSLLKAIRSGRPAGSQQFVRLVETLTGRHLSLGKRGPRRKGLPEN